MRQLVCENPLTELNPRLRKFSLKKAALKTIPKRKRAQIFSKEKDGGGKDTWGEKDAGSIR